MAEYGKRGRRFAKRSAVIGIAAAAIGSVAMAATLREWSRGMQHHLQGTTEQMQELEDREMVAFHGQSVTDSGVTVTLEQSVVNGSWGYVALKVSGYDLPEGAEPAFETSELRIKDWNGSFGISSSFDNGLATNGYRVVGEDGQEPETEEDGSLSMHWQDESGDLEYIFSIYINEETGKAQPSLSGKQVTINLKGLGYYEDNLDAKIEVPGQWHFSFTLPESDVSFTYDDLNQSIGDTGAIVESVEASPISMSITYCYPRKVLTEIGYHEEVIKEADGSEHYESIPFTYEYYQEPPIATGVKMKDGTVIMGINEGPGSSGYTDGTGETWVHRFGTGKLLDPENMASILFINTDTLPAEGEIDITEDNCFEVLIQ